MCITNQILALPYTRGAWMGWRNHIPPVGKSEGCSSGVLMNRCLRRVVHPRVRILSGNSMDVQRGKD